MVSDSGSLPHCSEKTIYESAHKILVSIVYVQMPLINAHTNVSSKAGLNFDLDFPLHSYFVRVHTGKYE